MKLRHLLAGLTLLVLLTGCVAYEEEVILTEPVMEEVPMNVACETGETDGIGGTGCEPLN